MNERKKIMRNTKAKRIKEYLTAQGLEYVSCKKQSNMYEVIATEPETGAYLQYMVAFADTIIIIQSMVKGCIQFVPDGEIVTLNEIVVG